MDPAVKARIESSYLGHQKARSRSILEQVKGIKEMLPHAIVAEKNYLAMKKEINDSNAQILTSIAPGTAAANAAVAAAEASSGSTLVAKSVCESTIESHEAAGNEGVAPFV